MEREDTQRTKTDKYGVCQVVTSVMKKTLVKCDRKRQRGQERPPCLIHSFIHLTNLISTHYIPVIMQGLEKLLNLNRYHFLAFKEITNSQL